MGTARARGQSAKARSLHRLFDDYWEFELREDPMYATYIGDHRYDDELGDASEHAFRRRVDAHREFLDRLHGTKTTGLSAKDRLSRELFERTIVDFLDGARFRPHLMPMSQQAGPHIDLVELTTFHPFHDRRGYDSYVARLRAFPKLLDDIVANMRTGIGERIVPARVTVEKIVPQLQAQVLEDPERSDLYAPAKEIPAKLGTVDAARVRRDLRDAIADAVVPAYEALSSFVQNEYLPAARLDAGVWSLPDGKERYSYKVRHHTTTAKTPDAIHDLGRRELARIHAEMRGILERMGFAGTVQEFAEKLRRDSGMYYRTGTELMAGFQEILRRMDEALPKLFRRLPKAKYSFREIEAFRAEAAPDAYYYEPPEDGSRPGYFYVNTWRPEQRPKYTMEALAYHEAVPGHHLQIGLARELSQLPKFRRHGDYTVFHEGWALYSERLPKDVGMYADPYQDFGRLTFQAWRAARLVVDTGIHAMRWTREQAIDFFRANTALSEHNIVSEVERYIAAPGQALAYMIGRLKIEEFRARAERRLGKRFDLRAFHDELLGEGALPLDILERKMARWLARRSPRPRRRPTVPRRDRSRASRP